MAPEPTTTPDPVDVPWIVSVDDHVIEPPHLWASRLPARLREQGPRVERLPAGELTLSGARVRRAAGHRRPARRLLGVRGSLPVAEARGDRGGPAAGRDDDDGDDVRGRAARLLRPRGASARHGHELDAGVAVVPELPAVLRPDVPRGEATVSSRCCASARTTTGWSRSGARRVAGGSCRCASCRSGIRRSPRPRSERNAARGVRAVCFSEIPAYLGLPSIHSGEWDPFFAACEATGTVALPPHRLGHEDAVDVGGCAARRHGDHRLRQLHELARRLAVLGQARAVPRACASCTRRARSAGSRTCSSGPTTSGSSTTRGSRPAARSTSHRRPTTTGRCTAASSATTTGWRRSTRAASTT